MTPNTNDDLINRDGGKGHHVHKGQDYNRTNTNNEVIDRDGEKGSAPDEEMFRSHYRSVESVTIPKECFEKLYQAECAPPRAVLRTVLGNPFPLALMGFLVAATPLSCALMGWRGAGGGGAADVGAFYFFGGLLLIIGSVMEWIIGNTFACCFFATYGSFFLTFGATFTPFYNASGAYYNSNETGNVLAMGEAEYYNTYGFFFLIMCILTFAYTFCAIRTNVALVLVLFFVGLTFLMLTTSYWTAAEGKAELALKLQIAAGAFAFIFCIFGWYLWFSLVLSTLDFPLELPVGDLSKFIPSKTKIRARKMQKDAEQGVDKASDKVE